MRGKCPAAALIISGCRRAKQRLGRALQDDAMPSSRTVLVGRQAHRLGDFGRVSHCRRRHAECHNVAGERQQVGCAADHWPQPKVDKLHSRGEWKCTLGRAQIGASRCEAHALHSQSASTEMADITSKTRTALAMSESPAAAHNQPNTAIPIKHGLASTHQRAPQRRKERDPHPATLHKACAAQGGCTAALVGTRGLECQPARHQQAVAHLAVSAASQANLSHFWLAGQRSLNVIPPPPPPHPHPMAPVCWLPPQSLRPRSTQPA